ncbi:MAG: M23 family metallopeptidase [Oligoflexales bacterium]|nr:M23 family metallopeptidase [Oligoflexales bacterium]
MSFVFALVTHGCRTIESPIYRVKVKSGDSLASIAQRYGTSWDAVLRLNNISDYRKIQVGDELFIKPGPGGWLARGSKADESFLGEVSPYEFNSALKTKEKESSADPDAQSSIPNLKNSSENSTTDDLSSKNDLKDALWPVQGDVSSGYGKRGRRFHYGIDIVAKSGTPIKAMLDGKVVFAGRRGSFGNLVVIEHFDGSKAYYAHCKYINKKVGDRIFKGEVVANVGRTGNATTAHLHFEYHLASGDVVNPLAVLPPLMSLAHD